MTFGRYNTIDTEEKLDALDKFLMDGNSPRNNTLAVDCETNGLHIHNNTIVGISLANSKNQGFYIPFLRWERDLKTLKRRTKDKIVYEDACKEGWLRCVWSGEKFEEFVTPKTYKINEIQPMIRHYLERWTAQVKLAKWNAPFDVNMIISSMGLDLTDKVGIDGALLVHILDENDTNSLKGNIPKYAKFLGIDPKAVAATEKKELYSTIIRNGGNKAGEVWRGDPKPQAKYACADAFLTYGICQAAMEEFKASYGDRGMKWFFKDEIMPLCREVVIPMKRKGIKINPPHFEALLTETQGAMYNLEDKLQEQLAQDGLLNGFDLGGTAKVSQRCILEAIMEAEDLPMPSKVDKISGKKTPSLAKAIVKKAYQENPHWIFGYILGTEEMKYSETEVANLNSKLYYQHKNKEAVEIRKPIKRHLFNINSDPHLRWLFIDRLGMDEKVLPKTDSSKPDNIIVSMKAEVLREYMLPEFPWVKTLLTYKKLVKLESTYIRPAVMLNDGGWLYVDLKQNGTGSGRFSGGGGYNLQTLPRADDELEALAECAGCGSENVTIKSPIMILSDLHCEDCGYTTTDIVRPSVIKRGFVAPDDYKVVAADYASLEPRCFSFMSNSESLKDVYRKGWDLYSLVYCMMFDEENKYSPDPRDDNFLKRVAKPKRTSVKGITLGVPYGASAGQVANMMGLHIEIMDKETKSIIKIPDMQEGKRIRDLYLKTFPELSTYMEEQELLAVTRGYVETIVGRRRHLPNAKGIQKVLQESGLDYTDLAGCSPRSLQKATCTPVSKATGVSMRLTKGMLNTLQKRLGLNWDRIKEKGNWAYIRGLLKADLNLAKNHPIQGLGAHITNLGMLWTARKIKALGLDSWVCLQVHDELILYAREHCVEAVVECVQNGMENNTYTDLVDVPMIAEPVSADNFADAK